MTSNEEDVSKAPDPAPRGTDKAPVRLAVAQPAPRGAAASGYGGPPYGGYGYGPEAGDGGGDDGQFLNLQALIGVLLRGKYVLAAICLIALSLTYLAISGQPPQYRATAELVIEENRQNVTNIDSVVDDLAVDFFTTQTEAAVVSSREIALAAVERLNLAENEDFNPALRPPQTSPVSGLMRAVSGWLGAFGVGNDSDEQAPSHQETMTEEEAAEIEKNRLASRYLRSQRVFASDTSRVISIEFVSVDPVLAARAANMTAELYIERQREQKGSIASSAGDFLTQQVQVAQQRFLESERALEDFRSKLGIQTATGAPAEEEQLMLLNADLSEARRELADTRASFRQVEELAAGDGLITTASPVLDSPLIRQLRVQEIELVRRLAELQTQFRPGHPDMILARAELTDLRERIADEVDKIAAQLRNEFQLAQQRVTTLEEEIAELRQTAATLNEREATMRALESEVRVNRALYDSLLQRLQETGVEQAAAQTADAQIISRAVPPDSPFAPRLGLSMALALVLSFGAGSAFLLLLETMDRGFRSLGQLQEAFGYPGIGLVPTVKLAKGEPAHWKATEDQSPFAEAIRSIRTGLLLASEKSEPLKTVMLASAQPGEGKTSMSLSLAVQSNRSGRRTLVIDCDTRRAMVDSYVGTKHDVGLSNYLEGDAGVADILQIDERTGLPYIPAGKRPAHPSDLLASPRMAELLRRVESQFDLVLLDSPPLLAVSDGMVLVNQVDAVLMMVAWAKTRRKVVESAVRMLERGGANIVGTVLTNVDAKKHAQYEYADSGYYYDRIYRGYYSSAA